MRTSAQLISRMLAPSRPASRAAIRSGVMLAAMIVSGTTVAMAQSTTAPSPAQAQTAAAGADIAGVWYDHTGRGAVELAPCGPSMCGKIVWLQEATTARGEPLTDQRNPNAGQRQRPICGLPVITALARKGDGTWDNGKIYNPDDGGTFDVAVRSLGRTQLEVVGYMGVKLFSQTYTWRRAPANIARCDAATAARAPAGAPTGQASGQQAAPAVGTLPSAPGAAQVPRPTQAPTAQR
jgi:uncharacterized protein (DUF2147 family)